MVLDPPKLCHLLNGIMALDRRPFWFSRAVSRAHGPRCLIEHCGLQIKDAIAGGILVQRPLHPASASG